MTTDTRRKVAASSVGGHESGGAVVVGCAKGSGMIAPNMATLLAYVCTDARIAPAHFQELVSSVSARTLNCLTVDGDTSTNDSLIALASAVSGPEVLPGTEDWKKLDLAVTEVLESLTIQLAADGEGATTVIEITVRGAADAAEARLAAMEVANSPLVKTAVHGRDANWGRIAMALGNSGARFDPARVTITVGDLVLLEKGTPLPFDEARALQVLQTDYLTIDCDLSHGHGECTVWTCDFSKDYIEINGAYRT
jgi:glutamate N-acetyltransferase/amino-acid N-acetyltransferase